MIAHPAEPVDQAAPDPARRGNVQPVDGVAVQVHQVDVQGLMEVTQGDLVVAHLGGDDRLDDRGKSGVSRRDRVVVLEVGLLLLGGEPVTLEEECQHDVGLLEHLEAVDHQRVVVQQQGPQVAGGTGEVPRLAVEEEVVLRVDAQPGVERDGHPLGAGTPLADLRVGQSEAMDDLGVLGRVVAANLLDRFDRRLEVGPGHHVGEEVVVHHRGVFVGAGHAVDVKRRVRVVAPETQVGPHPRGLHEDVDAVAHQEGGVAAGVDVLHQGVGDVGVDVDLRRTGGVVGRGLLAVDRAPREERSALGHLAGAGLGCGQHPSTELQGVPSAGRRGVGQERGHIDLGVPEVVTLVARTRHTLRGHPLLVGAGTGLGQGEEVVADRLLQRLRVLGRVAVGCRGGEVDLYVARGPELVVPLPLFDEVVFETLPGDTVQRAVAAIGEFPHGDAPRGVIGHGLLDPHRTTLKRIDPEDPFGQVVLVAVHHLVGVLAPDPVIGGDRDRHLGVGAPVAQDHSVVVVAAHSRE